MLLFIVFLLVTLLAIPVLEQFVEPRLPRRLFHKLSLLTAMPPVAFYGTMFMISYRPIFSAVATLLFFAAIVVLNNAKVAILREPLVFSDFALLRQAIRYPALYVRYIGVWKVTLVLVLTFVAIVTATTLEPPVIPRTEFDDYFPSILYLATILGMIYAVTRGPFRGPFSDLLNRFGPSADLRQDIEQLSLVVCLIIYFFLANEPQVKPTIPLARRPLRRRRPTHHNFLEVAGLPDADVVVVQSESFFDARHLHPSIPRTLLSNWDRLIARARYHGRLAVPAWGANTMRTEFAFLSGLPNAALGYHRFNPYLTLCKQPTWTLAHLFRSMGYRTVCIHPFDIKFFDRKTVFPNMGFDLFLDIQSFDQSNIFGPYVSDLAVADKICQTLGESNQPAFIFAITMENHGKWERGRLNDHPDDGLIETEPLGSFELGLYLRHLRNTDQLVKRISGELETRSGESVFCLFGDHLPAMPRVFDSVGLQDPRTDYLIWRKGGSPPCALDASAEMLGRLVLDTVVNAVPQERGVLDLVGGA